MQREVPGPGQESVWDYPRPPALLPSTQHVQVVLGGEVVADTHASYRVLETSHPPTYYLPVEDFAAGALRASDGTSFCEWKGVAAYFDLAAGGRTERRVAWGYPDPTPEYLALLDHVALYPGRVDRCTVDGEVVPGAAGQLLRRLGDQSRRRAVQGRPRDDGMVRPCSSPS
jgi:uncharacterized protein (DUF427 family)